MQLGEIGEIEQAEADLRHAIANPLPYFNLAIVTPVPGQVIAGDNLLSIAAEKDPRLAPVHV
jgi:hypothetical protein